MVPLAYFSQETASYLGEVHHGGKWFEGEHKSHYRSGPRSTGFKNSSNPKLRARKVKRSESGALPPGQSSSMTGATG